MMRAQRSLLLWGFVAAGCRRETCVPDIRSNDAAVEAFVAEAADVFLRQLSPEYAVCVPEIRIGDDVDASSEYTPGDWGYYELRSRKVFLQEYSLRAFGGLLVNHEFMHALHRQNGVVLGREWALDEGIRDEIVPDPDVSWVNEGFAIYGQVMPVFGALLTSACSTDDNVSKMRRRTLDYFVFEDLEPFRGDPGIFVEPGTFVERLRGPLGGYVADYVDALAFVHDDSIVDWTSFTVERESWSPKYPGFGVRTTPLEEVTGDGVKLVDHAAVLPTRRRVLEEADTLRLLGDGCVRENEATFVWAGRQWSTWTDGDEMVVGFWDVP